MVAILKNGGHFEFLSGQQVLVNEMAWLMYVPSFMLASLNAWFLH